MNAVASDAHGNVRTRTPVEDMVAEYYRTVELPAEQIESMRSLLHEHIHLYGKLSRQEVDRQEKRLAKLDRERPKLLQAHLAEAVPLDLLREEQHRINSERIAAQAVLDRKRRDVALLAEQADEAADRLLDCYSTYTLAPAAVRRGLNSFFPLSRRRPSAARTLLR